MKRIKYLCGVSAVLAFTACIDNSDETVGNDKHIWHVTLQASLGDAATLRALNASGNKIIASFAQNDEVVVVNADGSKIVGILKAQTAGASTTLSGTLDAKTLTEGEMVTLRYLSATANYDGQMGTLDSIAAKQDYAEGTLKVSSTSPLTFESNSVTLKSKQSITKFTFKSGESNVKVKTFGIAATGLVQSISAKGIETVGAVTGTLTTPSSDVYVALRNKGTGSQTYSFTIQDEGGNWYMFEKNATLINGKNYAVTITLPTKLPTLTNSSSVGDKGVIDGLPAIVLQDGTTVALMNAGALCPEHYGKYYTYAELSSAVSDGWDVPSKEELTALSAKPNTCNTQNGVKGCIFTIGGEKLFLPAAGYYDNDTSYDSSTGGHYWSTTNSDSGKAISLSFFSAVSVVSDYKVNELTVRPFHALP